MSGGYPGSVLQDVYDRGLSPDIFHDTQKINTKQNRTLKNKFIKMTDLKIHLLCNLSKLSVIHFLSKFQESYDELQGQVLLSSSFFVEFNMLQQ